MAPHAVRKFILGIGRTNARQWMHTVVAMKGTAAASRVKASGGSHSKVDTHWFELLQEPWMTRKALLEQLSCSVVYQDEHILALNKPNGLPMHAVKYTEENNIASMPIGDELSMISLLPELQEKMKIESLSEIYSQSRLFSGLTIFTKTDKAREILKKYFTHVRTNKVFFQDFWTVTVGIPDPPNGEEEMGIEMREIGNWKLAVKLTKPGNRRRQARTAINPSFSYKLINKYQTSQSSTGLVEISTTTTKWDSLQLFLLHKRSPILGDHKYSNRLKMVLGTPVLLDAKNCYPCPQVIPFDTCQLLGLAETETCNIPLHIHCRRVTLPQIGKKGSTFTVEAPLPPVFQKTLECLSNKSNAI